MDACYILTLEFDIRAQLIIIIANVNRLGGRLA